MNAEYGVDHEPQDNNPLAGLDMGNTIAWYKDNLTQLRLLSLDQRPEVLENIPFDINEEQQLRALNKQDIAAIFQLFPDAAQSRSILEAVTTKPSAWFHRDSKQGALMPTELIEEAISPTAIIPGKIDYGASQKGNTYGAFIDLHRIPENVNQGTARVIETQALIHEMGHSFITPVLYGSGDYRLRLPNGEVVDGVEHITKFANMAENHSPISHYASTYRKNREFVGEDKRTPVAEELTESIAARILGFVYTEDEGRRLDPFKDRPEIAEFVDTFLAAERLEE